MIVPPDRLYDVLRGACVDVAGQRILIARLAGSEQEPDLTEPPNCHGYGRIRHFRRLTSPGWPNNPLPIDPACRFLGVMPVDTLRAQAFQINGCNWRCWYCFVPFSLLAGRAQRGRWCTPGDLLDMMAGEEDSPRVVDLTGGQPDIAPEWALWVLQEILARKLGQDLFLWSDDNLSGDHFWRYLDPAQIRMLRAHQGYARVGCFKGFDEESFAFNTGAPLGNYGVQFEVFDRLRREQIDLYGYVTLTCPSATRVEERIGRFMDRLQAIHEALPLRTVPLEIKVFNAVKGRLNAEREVALRNQQVAVDAWLGELDRRFGTGWREMSILDASISDVR